MRVLVLMLLLVSACGKSARKSDACGYDPKCMPVTIGTVMTVACRCFDHPVRRIQEPR